MGSDVTDLEDRIRESLRDPRRQLPVWPDPMPRIRRAGRRQRASQAAGIGLVTAVITAAVVVPLLALQSQTGVPPASSTSGPGRAAATGSPPRGWIRHADSPGSGRAYIDTPATWQVSTSSALAGPSVLWTIGTGRVPNGGSCGPTAALRALPADGVLFVVMEYGDAQGEPYTFPPRAGPLGLGPLAGPTECWGVPSYSTLFEDAGRYFQVQAAFGSKALASLYQQVTRSLNSLRVAPLAGAAQPTSLCRAGQWTYCPQAAWVYELINRAGVFHLGHRGTHAILGLAAKQSFAVWTSPNRPTSLNQCSNIAKARVCRSGTRLTWTVQGLWILIRPADSPYSPVSASPGLPHGVVLARLIRASQATGLSLR
jgi:hypothetical protein